MALKAGRGGSSFGLRRRSGEGKKRTDQRAFAFAAGMNLQSSAKLSQALAHSADAYPGSTSWRRNKFRALLKRDALALVFHFHADATVGMRDKNSGHGTSGVAMDVGQTLLHDAKDGRFQVAGQAAKILGHLQVDVDLAALGKAPYVPREGRGQPAFVAHSRMSHLPYRP